MKKNKTKAIGFVIGVITVGLAAGGGWYSGWFAEMITPAVAQQPTSKKPAPKVTIASPLVMPIVEWDEYIGRLDAVETVEMRARVSGHLQAHYFQEGDMVNAGDPLFLIDPRPFEAVLTEARAELAESKSAVVEAQAMQAQSEAQREQVVARRDLASKQLVRLAKLVKNRAISQDEYDEKYSEKRQAIADLAAATAAIDSAKARKLAARAAVKSAAAAVQTAELNLSFTEITAPISGRISRAYATKGNLIAGGSEGATLLTTIVSSGPIHCYFDANERELLKYIRLDRSGDRESSRTVKNPVYLSLVDEDGYVHKGHMDFVDNRIDSGTGTIRGRAIFPNDDNVLAPGMFAKMRLPGSGTYTATLIPDSAIGLDQTERYVIVVDADNSTQRRHVKLGPIVHGLRVVREGLTEGDRIVTHGLQRIRSGTEVTPSVEQIVAVNTEGLPNEYTPIPEDQWLNARRPAAPVETFTVADARGGN